MVSEVPFDYKEIIYQLGKHHRKPLSETRVPFGMIQSEIFGFPLPEWVNSYKEIRIADHLNLGSHMLLWGEVLNEKYLRIRMGICSIFIFYTTCIRGRGLGINWYKGMVEGGLFRDQSGLEWTVGSVTSTGKFTRGLCFFTAAIRPGKSPSMYFDMTFYTYPTKRMKIKTG